jgi:hypothetical protein
MNEFLSGAIAMGYFVSAVFFLRFWSTSKDRFFLFFATAFSIEGLNRILLSWASVHSSAPEKIPVLYVIRLAAYLLILFAIFDKNRTKKKLP